jgi:hypothetical protein
MLSINSQIRNFIKILPVGAELFHAEALRGIQSYMTKLSVAFSNFVDARKNCIQFIAGYLSDYEDRSSSFYTCSRFDENSAPEVPLQHET